MLMEQKWSKLPIRTRPHRNPLADNEDGHPNSPEMFAEECSKHYSENDNSQICFADIGCAFGGMLFALAPLYPEICMIGLEIRPKVVEFAQEKTLQLRHKANELICEKTKEDLQKIAECKEEEHEMMHHYNNIWFEQLNVMKFGSNCFSRGQLSKLFFCYPDPHWKRKNIRRRIISPGLLHEYAYWLRSGGKVYTVSDVEELQKWMEQCLDNCPLFRKATEEELSDEKEKQVIRIALDASEDAQRTKRRNLSKFYAVHVRV